jgi:hypothetical protein
MQDIDKMLAGVQQPEAAGYQGLLIQQVQKALEEAGGDVGPWGFDGKWGDWTSRNWNAFAKKHPEAGLPQTTEHQAPSNAIMRKMYATHVVCFECLNDSSPHKGNRRAVMVGPKNIFKTVNQANRKIEESDGSVMEPVGYWQTTGGNDV